MPTAGDAPPDPPQRPSGLLTAAIALALALAVYLPAALRADFLRTWDDNFYFGPDNATFAAGPGTLLDPSQTIANVYLPTAHLSLWLDWWLGGGAPLLPHLVAVLWHAAAVLLLVRLAMACGVRALPAHLAGALFALHPALAESVAWVSGRKDLVAAVFGLAALRLAVAWGERPRALVLLGAAVAQALAMYGKATAVVVPVLAGLIAVVVGTDRRRWIAPLVLVAVTAPIALHHQAIAAAEGTMAAGAAGERLAQVPGAFLHYLGTTLWPVALNALHPEVQTLELFRERLGPGLAAVAAFAIAVGLAARSRRWRLVAVLLLAYAAALLPFNTAFPASSIAAADRYLYLAVPFAALAAVQALFAVLPPRAATAVAAAFMLPLAWLGGGRAREFRDDETLWRSSLAVDPDNAVAHLNLVFALLQRGPAELGAVREHLLAAARAARYPVHALRAERLLTSTALADGDTAAAASHARLAIAAAERLLADETAPARRQLAQVELLRAHLAAFVPLQQAGDEAGALASWRAAAALAPDHPDVLAFGSLRDLEATLRQVAEAAASGGVTVLRDDDPRCTAALATLDAGLAAHPSHAGLHCARAAWLRAADRVLPALASYRRAMAVDPQCLDAWLGAARLLRERDQCAEAEGYARRGLAVRPDDPGLLQELSLALVGQGRLDDAVAALEAWLRVRPADKDAAKVLANVLVGQAYARLGDGATSHAAVLALVERALTLNPREMKAHLVLGRVRREQRRYADAVQHLEEAHRLLPQFDDARDLLLASLNDLGYEHLLRGDEDAAAASWRRYRELDPEGAASGAVGLQLQGIWRRREARGVQRLQQGDRAGAIADFRTCLEIEPDQHWAAWLLAQALHDQPDVDLAELEDLCRKAVAWQQQHGLERSQQVYLLAATLVRSGRPAAAQELARDYLAAPDAEAKPAVVAALRQLAGS